MSINITDAIMKNEMQIYGTKQAVNPDKRVLIVGLGGTGTDSLLVVKDAIISRFQMKDNEVPANIGLLALDTDIGILEKKRGKAQIDKNTEYYQLNDPNIANNLHNKSNLPRYYRNWVNPNLTVPPGVVPGTDGAGAIRQIGRYLLMSNYSGVYSKIEEKLKKVMQASQGGIVDIIILSGISGGTGSGTFIDMGYIVRKVCSGLALGNLQKQITAYLFLPDVNKGNPNVPTHAYKFIEANGYAALKDLDYFMSIPDKKTVAAGSKANDSFVFSQKYGNGQNEDVRMDEAPYDSTYLISGVPSVLNQQQDAYEYSINIAADSIVNFLGGSINAGHSTGTAGVAAVDINSAAMIAAQAPFTIVENNEVYNLLANYKYKVLGASTATLPMNEIADYLAGRFLEKVDILINQQPMANDFDALRKISGLDNVENNIYAKLGSQAKITPADLKSSPENASVFVNNLKRWRTNALTNIPAYVEQETEKLEKDILGEINRVFSNIEKGPFFANKLMADEKNGIIALLTAYVSRIQNREQKYRGELQKLNINSQKALNSAQTAIMGKTRYYDQYISDQCKMYEYSVRAEICQSIRKNFDSNNLRKNSTLIDRIRQKNKDVFNVYTQILQTLQQKFGQETVVAKKSGKIFIWDIVQLKDIKTDIDNILSDVNLDQMLNQLLQDMVDNSAKWCASSSVFSEFSDFISEKFSLLLGLSMDAFLEHIDPDILNANIDKLQREAEVHFPFNNKINKAAVANIYDRVTVPNDAPKLADMISKKINKVPEKSQLREKISWTKVTVGVSICQYAYLQNFESTYESIDPNKKQGMHLYENEGITGVNYPALLPKYYRDNNYKNIREDERIAALEKLYDKAEKLKIIDFNPNAAFVKITAKDWAENEVSRVLSKYKTTRENLMNNEINMPRSEMSSCKNELSQILKADNEYESYFYLPNTAGYGQKPDAEIKYYAKSQFTQMPDAAVFAEEEIKKYNFVISVIDKVDNIINSFSGEKDTYMHFVYAMCFDIIKRKGTKYIYGEGEDTTELMNIFNNPLWRYNLFEGFKNSIYDVERDNILELISDAQGSDEGLVKLKKFCEDTLKNLSKEMVNVRNLSDGSEETESKRDFYSKLGIFLKDEIDMIDSIM